MTAENIHEPIALAARTLGPDIPMIHACAVGKMVPVQEPLGDPDEPLTIRAEAFNTLYADGVGWASAPPTDVPDLRLVDDIEAWMNRKLYIHNLGHSACAWISRALDPSIPTISDAISDSEIASLTEMTMCAGARVVGAAHSDVFSQEDLTRHVDDLLQRFGNPGLGDTVERVGCDLSRKLARNDRVVGCLLLAAEVEPDALPAVARAYATALGFGVAGISTSREDCAITASAITRETAAGDLSGLHSTGSSTERLALEAIVAAPPYQPRSGGR